MSTDNQVNPKQHLILHARCGAIIGNYDRQGMRRLLISGGMLPGDYWCYARRSSRAATGGYVFDGDMDRAPGGYKWNERSAGPSPLHELVFEPVRYRPDPNPVLHTACLKLVSMRIAVALLRNGWALRVRSSFSFGIIVGPKYQLTEDDCMVIVMRVWQERPDLMKVTQNGLEFTPHAELDHAQVLRELLVKELENAAPHYFETHTIGHLKGSTMSYDGESEFEGLSVFPIPA